MHDSISHTLGKPKEMNEEMIKEAESKGVSAVRDAGASVFQTIFFLGNVHPASRTGGDCSFPSQNHKIQHRRYLIFDI